MRFIGGKSLLLQEIDTIINENIKKSDKLSVFCDIFSGTGVVGKYFKNKYKIISNDMLYFSYILQKANIESNNIPNFNELKKYLGIDDILDYLNNLNIPENVVDESYFIYYNYTPNKNSNRMYLSNENGKKIDYIRQSIDKWKNEKIINENEYYYLLACLIESIPYVSNMSGTYGAFFKHWDKRALNKIKLDYLDVINNNKNNRVYNKDVNVLISEICGDILYLDPPYNHRQYLPNYHVLETIGKYDYPNIKGVTGIREYTEEDKSKYCIKTKAINSFQHLIENAKFKYIVMSYNNEGIMKESEIESILTKYSVNGKIIKKIINYRKYKGKKDHVSNEQLYEILYFIERGNND